MNETARPSPDVEESDRHQFVPAFGHGGVPWYLVVLYLAFLVFFTWYCLEYQLPDYLWRGPGRMAETPAADQ